MSDFVLYFSGNYAVLLSKGAIVRKKEITATYKAPSVPEVMRKRLEYGSSRGDTEYRRQPAPYSRNNTRRIMDVTDEEARNEYDKSNWSGERNDRRQGSANSDTRCGSSNREYEDNDNASSNWTRNSRDTRQSNNQSWDNTNWEPRRNNNDSWEGHDERWEQSNNRQGARDSGRHSNQQQESRQQDSHRNDERITTLATKRPSFGKFVIEQNHLFMQQSRPACFGMPKEYMNVYPGIHQNFLNEAEIDGVYARRFIRQLRITNWTRQREYFTFVNGVEYRTSDGERRRTPHDPLANLSRDAYWAYIEARMLRDEETERRMLPTLEHDSQYAPEQYGWTTPEEQTFEFKGVKYSKMTGEQLPGPDNDDGMQKLARLVARELVNDPYFNLVDRNIRKGMSPMKSITTALVQQPRYMTDTTKDKRPFIWEAYPEVPEDKDQENPAKELRRERERLRDAMIMKQQFQLTHHTGGDNPRAVIDFNGIFYFQDSGAQVQYQQYPYFNLTPAQLNAKRQCYKLRRHEERMNDLPWTPMEGPCAEGCYKWKYMSKGITNNNITYLVRTGMQYDYNNPRSTNLTDEQQDMFAIAATQYEMDLTTDTLWAQCQRPDEQQRLQAEQTDGRFNHFPEHLRPVYNYLMANLSQQPVWDDKRKTRTTMDTIITVISALNPAILKLMTDRLATNAITTTIIPPKPQPTTPVISLPVATDVDPQAPPRIPSLPFTRPTTRIANNPTTTTTDVATEWEREQARQRLNKTSRDRAIKEGLDPDYYILPAPTTYSSPSTKRDTTTRTTTVAPSSSPTTPIIETPTETLEQYQARRKREMEEAEKRKKDDIKQLVEDTFYPGGFGKPTGVDTSGSSSSSSTNKPTTTAENNKPTTTTEPFNKGNTSTGSTSDTNNTTTITPPPALKASVGGSSTRTATLDIKKSQLPSFTKARPIDKSPTITEDDEEIHSPAIATPTNIEDPPDIPTITESQTGPRHTSLSGCTQLVLQSITTPPATSPTINSLHATTTQETSGAVSPKDDKLVIIKQSSSSIHDNR